MEEWATTMHVIGGQCKAVEGRGRCVKEMKEAVEKIVGAARGREKKGRAGRKKAEQGALQTQAGKMAEAAVQGTRA